ncbi:MAG: DUF2062 domain-containing protein [Planctomycetota bacterium]|jgi:uncharacterized protein (DUF2062 family)
MIKGRSLTFALRSEVYMQTIFGSTARFIKCRILHVNDSPNRIAKGVAIGLFVGWTPLIGLHTLIVLPLAVLMRANKPVALACVWVTNIFTAMPIYYFNYLIGRFLFGTKGGEKELISREIGGMLKNLLSFSNFGAFLYRADFWHKFWRLIVNIRVELWLGSLIVGTIVSVIAYFTFYYLITWYQKTHPHSSFVDE